MIEVGTYKARATGECVLGSSKTKETPFIEVYFTITDGDSKGQSVRWTSYFTEKTNERTITSLQTMGWQGDDLSEFSNGELHGLDTNEVSIVVEHEPYENEKGESKVSAKVSWVNSVGGFLNVKQRMDQGAAAAFAQRMRGLVHATKAKNPVVQQKPSNGVKAPPVAVPTDFGSDDEIPF